MDTGHRSLPARGEAAESPLLDVKDVTLPWSYDVTTTQPAVFTNVVAQGNSSSLGCRITIDGQVKDERTVNTLNAYTYCLEKSG